MEDTYPDIGKRFFLGKLSGLRILVHVVHFSMQKSGMFYGANIDFFLDPLRAFSGDLLLFQAISELQLRIFNVESLSVGFFRVERLDKARLSEQKPKTINRIQLIF